MTKISCLPSDKFHETLRHFTVYTALAVAIFRIPIIEDTVFTDMQTKYFTSRMLNTKACVKSGCCVSKVALHHMMNQQAK